MSDVVPFNVGNIVSTVAQSAISDMAKTQQQKDAEAKSYRAIGILIEAQATIAEAQAYDAQARTMTSIVKAAEEQKDIDPFFAMCYKAIAGRMTGVEAID